MNLRFDMIKAGINNPRRVMAQLGITYQHATRQTMADQWWFWNCQGVPGDLPSYITELKGSPHDFVGHGLSKEEADRIANGDTGL